MTTLPPAFWSAESSHLRSVVQPRLLRMAVFGALEAEKKLASLGLSFDNALAHADAAAWARRYTDTLLEQLGTTTQRGIGEIIASFAETGMSMKDLQAQLMTVLDNNAVRASNVAVTEATRAFAEGNAAAYRRVGLPELATHAPGHVNCRCGERVVRLKSGEWVIVWTTNNDELVCHQPLHMPWGEVAGCRDMHDRIISVGAHLGQKLSEANLAHKDDQ